MPDCRELAIGIRLYEKILECFELKEKLRKWESLAISNIQGVMDIGWENAQLLMKNELLRSNIEFVEKELKVAKVQIEKADKDLKESERISLARLEELWEADIERKELREKVNYLNRNDDFTDEQLAKAVSQRKLESDKKRLQSDIRILMEKVALTEWKADKNWEGAQIYVEELKKAQDSVRTLKKELKVARGQADKNWRKVGVLEEQLNSALSSLGTLEFDKKRLQNEVGGLRAALVEKPKTEKDLESARTLKELAATIIDLRVRLSNCAHWATYGVVPNIWDAMALIRKEVSNV